MSATFFLLLLAHLLGDFYFQSHDMAIGKQDDPAVLRKHCRYYDFTLLGVGAASGILLFHSFAVFAASLLAAAAHAAIDWLKFLCRKRWKNFYLSKWCFLADQALHLILLAVISGWFRASDTLFFFHWTVSSQDIRFLCLLILLGKPCNVALKRFNQKPEALNQKSWARGEEDSDYPAGAAIGVLERLLTAIHFLLQAYSAIGVVLAAKTLTRYPRLQNDPDFCEYYLIGTLSSLLLAIGAALLFFPPDELILLLSPSC